MSNHRRKCLEEKGEQCEYCDATVGIQVHHIDGDRGNGAIDNLMPLCIRHHSDLHRRGLNGLEDHLKPVEDRSHIDQSKTTFQITVSKEQWDEWKRTVQRDKSLKTRIIELIVADVEERITSVREEAQSGDECN